MTDRRAGWAKRAAGVRGFSVVSVQNRSLTTVIVAGGAIAVLCGCASPGATASGSISEGAFASVVAAPANTSVVAVSLVPGPGDPAPAPTIVVDDSMTSVADLPAQVTGPGGSVFPGAVGDFEMITDDQAVNSLKVLMGDLSSYPYLADAALNQFGTPRNIPMDQWDSFQFNHHLLAYFQAQEAGMAITKTHTDAVVYADPNSLMLVEKLQGDIGDADLDTCSTTPENQKGCLVNRSGAQYAFRWGSNLENSLANSFISEFLLGAGEMGL